MAVGRVFSDRYQIQELLGRGGMAAVWRGRDLRLDRPVAIKELAGPWLEDPTAMERFDREARTAARLAHPNIVAVHDVGIHDNSRYLVMELIEGATLAEMLADGPLPVAQAIEIAAQTCDGLAAAHAAGIIHRDVKPANLMLTPAGIVKICDFGIARALLTTADASLTGPMLAMGSSNYMAPEQAYGGHLDARADLYALGCTMYAMLAGAAPFSGDASQVLQQHLNQPPVPLREHRADIPPRLEALVAHLLAKTPAARPTDAAEVRARLKALSQDPTTAVIPMSAGALAAVPKVSLPAAIQPRAVAPLSPASAGGADPANANGPSRAPNTRNWPLAAAALVIALAAVVISFVVTSRSVPGGAADSRATSAALLDTPTAPSVTASPQPQAITQPSTFTESSRSAQQGGALQPSSQAPPVDPIVAMRLSIQRQVNTGNLNPDKASDLYKKVDEIARAMNEGNTEEAAKKVKELRDRLASLLSEGQLSGGGHDTLIRDLDSVAAALP